MLHEERLGIILCFYDESLSARYYYPPICLEETRKDEGNGGRVDGMNGSGGPTILVVGCFVRVLVGIVVGGDVGSCVDEDGMGLLVGATVM